MERETKILLGIIGFIVAGMVGLFVVFNQGGTSTTADVGKLVREDSQKKGSGSVTMVEFGDYQCPSCAAVDPTIQRLLAEYPDKLTFVFRNFPLEAIHKNAQVAAKYAEASAKQNKFWEMHDQIYARQSEWSELGDPTDRFLDYAKSLGMNTDQLKKDATSTEISKLISRDIEDGNALGVTGTPTFFINGKQIANNNYDSLKAAIEEALKQ
jgi:protein-disulfide isomerase